MAHGPVTLSRRHVLGDLYARCEHVVEVPVFLDDVSGERLGFADESQGIYADAFTFRISEEYCKKLAEGQLLYSFNYDLSGKGAKGVSALGHLWRWALLLSIGTLASAAVAFVSA